MYQYSFLFLFVFVISCSEKHDYINPQNEKITESVYAAGAVKSEGQYQVFSKANGILKTINVKEGDIVRKGQELFILSNEVSKLNADNAQLIASNADIGTNMDKLRELSLTIEVSKKKMDNDLSILNRTKKLWRDQIGTKNELDQRTLAYSNSKATYQSALLRYNDLKKQLEFTSQQSKKSLSISKSMMSDFVVKSEVGGKVYSILKEKGEMISSQTPIAIIGDANNFTLYLQVDENDIVKVQPNQKVVVSMDSYKGKIFEANITRINPFMNERARSFEVEAQFISQPPTLYPNLTAEANIILQTKENALTIPRSYLIDEEYVIMSNNEKRKVKVGLKDYQKVEILEGLQAKDKIYLVK